MSDDSLKDKAEVEIVCSQCGYRMTRTAARLRRETKIICPECGKPVTNPDP
jgi:DNA-directed RNA polymerase subunit RPC12/RpoP